MRKVFSFLPLFAAVALFFACEPLGTDDPENTDNGSNSKDKTDIHMIDGQALYELSAGKDTVAIRFTVTLDDKDVDWSISSSADWCKAEPASGKGLGEVNIVVADNGTASAREANVTITAGKKTNVIKVSQCFYAGALPDEAWFSKAYYERTDREKAGLRGPVKSWHVSTYTTFSKYYYDEAGHLIKEEDHNTENKSVEVTWEHSYDAQGRRVKSEHKYGSSDDQGGRYFTYEYNNSGKVVATDPFCWIEYKDGWVSGNDSPMSSWKDLSAMHYVDDSPAYYARTDCTYEFQADGNLKITQTYNYDREASRPEVAEYLVKYENGFPVSCANSGVSVSYDAKGVPTGMKTDDGAQTYSFLAHPRLLLLESMQEPKAQGMVAMFWRNNSFDSNGDESGFECAYFSADQVYTYFYGKYFYDSHGNWIQREEISEPAFQHGEHFTSIVNREIEYY